MTDIEQSPIWIVMSLNENREAFCHAVCTNEERASIYKELIEKEPHLNVIKVWVNKSEANHLWVWNLAQESRPINARDYIPLREENATLKLGLMEIKASLIQLYQPSVIIGTIDALLADTQDN